MMAVNWKNNPWLADIEQLGNIEVGGEDIQGVVMIAQLSMARSFRRIADILENGPPALITVMERQAFALEAIAAALRERK